MQANRLDACLSTSFLTLLLVRLQCSDKNFGGGGVSRDGLSVLGDRVDLIVVAYTKRNKKLLGTINA